MSTDIRAFIEYRDETRDFWLPYAEVCPERDYRVFGAIAGVRVEGAAMMQPRGFPDDASALAELAYYVRVVPDDAHDADGLERFIRASEAQSLMGSGGHYRDDAREWVSHPDAVSPSWLTTAELRLALEAAGIAVDSLGMEWQLILDTLTTIEERFGHQARLVFWFE